MSAGMNPLFVAKLNPNQRAWIKTAKGVKFVKEFLWKKGNHCFVFGTTGSGKTQKLYLLLYWLKHGETQIWFSTGKSDEILPLFFMGMKVRVIVPKGTSIEIQEEHGDGVYEPLDEQPEIIEVSSPIEAWHAVKKPSWNKNRNKVFDTISIFEFRNTIPDNSVRLRWMSELFETLAFRTRLKQMPKIFPCTIYLDEAQWAIAGQRISRDAERERVTETIIENVLEMRSAGCRFVLSAQDYTNVPPAIRQNMLCSIICRGADVARDESKVLAQHTRGMHGRTSPAHFKRDEGYFVHADGTVYPVGRPWIFPLFPLELEDRERIKHMRVKYSGEYAGEPVIIPDEELDYTSMNLGIYADRVIKPAPEPQILSRHGSLPVPDALITD
ncbi:MAG: hypothetical protein OS112_06005 [Methanoregula sp.]|nr:MAG: hypothetical protein OS112_06005 [Methanoregula sp.]